MDSLDILSDGHCLLRLLPLDGVGLFVKRVQLCLDCSQISLHHRQSAITAHTKHLFETEEKNSKSLGMSNINIHESVMLSIKFYKFVEGSGRIYTNPVFVIQNVFITIECSHHVFQEHIHQNFSHPSTNL